MLLLRRPQRHPSGTDGTNSVPRCESALRPRISSKTARGGCRGFQKRSHFANVTDTAKHFRAPLLQMPRTCTRWGTQPSSRMRSFNVCFIFSLGGWRCFGTPFLNYGHLRFLGCRETNHLIFFSACQLHGAVRKILPIKCIVRPSSINACSCFQGI